MTCKVYLVKNDFPQSVLGKIRDSLLVNDYIFEKGYYGKRYAVKLIQSKTSENFFGPFVLTTVSDEPGIVYAIGREEACFKLSSEFEIILAKVNDESIKTRQTIVLETNSATRDGNSFEYGVLQSSGSILGILIMLQELESNHSSLALSDILPPDSYISIENLVSGSNSISCLVQAILKAS